LQTILEKLVALTETINTIKTNAKKINELPAQSVLDPGSEIHVSKNGKSERLEIQKIISAIKSSSYDRILAIGTITQVGNTLTIPGGAQAEIGGVVYVTAAIFPSQSHWRKPE
jgi:hypothetical protein